LLLTVTSDQSGEFVKAHVELTRMVKVLSVRLAQLLAGFRGAHWLTDTGKNCLKRKNLVGRSGNELSDAVVMSAVEV